MFVLNLLFWLRYEDSVESSIYIPWVVEEESQRPKVSFHLFFCVTFLFGVYSIFYARILFYLNLTFLLFIWILYNWTFLLALWRINIFKYGFHHLYQIVFWFWLGGSLIICSLLSSLLGNFEAGPLHKIKTVIKWNCMMNYL